jgi:16S rRNA processing protein RimM
LVRPRTDDPAARFEVGALLHTEDGRPLRVRASRELREGLVVAFDQVTDRNAAEALRSAVLWADVPDEPEPLGADEFHDTHLIGLEVRDLAGNRVGEVAGVEHYPAQDVLVLADQTLIPFVGALVPEVDVAAGYLSVNAIPGLIGGGDAP